MKRKFLLSFCLVSIYGISACSHFVKTDEQDFYIDNNDTVEIDATVNPYNGCGENGISCNDSALVNYSKTDANFRTYGERTRRDNLYTQAGKGNNLVATIRPDVEDEKVDEISVESSNIKNEKEIKYAVEDGIFSDTGTFDLEANPKDYENQNSAENNRDDSKNNVGIASNIKLDTPSEYVSDIKKIIEEDGSVVETKKIIGEDGSTGELKKVTQPDGTIVRTRKTVETNGSISEIKKVTNSKGELQELKKTVNKDGEIYEVVCEEDCEDFLDDDEDVVLSEFTEESFDIADYIDDEEIKFEEVGSIAPAVAKNEVKDVKITDTTILTWEAKEGDNLRELLTQWSDMAGWKLLWNTNRNYILSAGVMFKGKFADVSSALIRAFARARPAPIATYYKGNRVIVIETMENENAY